MIKLKRFFFLLVSVLLVLFSCTCFPAYASDSEFNQYYIGRSRVLSTNEGNYGAGRIESGSNIYLYRETNRSYQGWNDVLYFVSDAPFTYYSFGYYFKTMDECNKYQGFGSSLKQSQYASVSGTYYGSVTSVASNTQDRYGDISFITDLPTVIYDSALGDPWKKSDFVLGEGAVGGGETTNSIVYDASIPAPENLTFKSESVGGFLGVGSKWEHTLSWSNGLASPPLFARVYSVAEVVFADTGQFFEDSTIPLVRAEDGYKAETGRYSVGTDYLSSKIMDGPVLNKVLEYRIQFCRYDADGNLAVGPVSTVHIKQNIFGKYDGYTVTTEYPKDDTDLGQSGGMDDNYTDKWTSDGNHYDDYDKDGNLVGSGTSSDGNFIKNLIDSLLNIPTLINSLFKSLQDMMSGIGELPVLLGKLFSFLPGELIGFVGIAFLVVIVLRIFGR